ncbi:MAG TPA: ABC transporter ATP-binding protein [Patescibacteria group bacterium]|nr:ABC transporter ATP-binding protein [Patescibacteria group bacterium]
MMQAKNIGKKFTLDSQEITALENVSFEIDKGEFAVVIGPSGCGKSTLLRILAGLESPTSGSVIWKEEKTIGFVFQSFALFPYLTVLENIEFGLKMKSIVKSKRHEVAKELIKEVGLLGFENKHPKELSGGMKQRVGIARALAISPNVLLLDEPFSSLDEFTAENLRSLILSIWKKRQITIILVTHLVEEAIELSDKIIVMTSGPGRVKSLIENKLKRPRNLRSKEFYSLEDKLENLIKTS